MGMRCGHPACEGEIREYEYGVELFLHKAMHAADDDGCTIAVRTSTGSYEGEFGPGDVEEFLGRKPAVGPATKGVLGDMAVAFKSAVAAGAEQIRMIYGSETMNAFLAELEDGR